jgi:hypothetical protein
VKHDKSLGCFRLEYAGPRVRRQCLPIRAGTASATRVSAQMVRRNSSNLLDCTPWVRQQSPDRVDEYSRITTPSLRGMSEIYFPGPGAQKFRASDFQLIEMVD